jgi:hypothetical protein
MRGEGLTRGEERVGVPGPRVGVVTPLAPPRVGVTRPGVFSPGPCCTGVVRPLPCAGGAWGCKHAFRRARLVSRCPKRGPAGSQLVSRCPSC